MTVQTPEYLQNVGSIYSAEHMRRVNRWLAGNTTGPLKVGDLAVTANGTPNMTVNVASGDGGVLGLETSLQGLYYLLNDASKSVTINAADGTNPRNTLIVMRVRDQVYSGSSNDGDIIAVDGSPAASPVDPTPTGNFVILARVRVNAGATSIVSGNITDLRVWRAEKVVAGLSGFRIRDSGDTRDNLAVSDAGIVTARNAIIVPGSAGGTPATSSYGNLPIKLDEKVASGSSGTLSFTSIPSGFRNLYLKWFGQTSDAAAQQVQIQFNTDTGQHYFSNSLDVSSVTSVAEQGFGASGVNQGRAGAIPASASLNTGGGRVDIYGYAQTTFRVVYTYHSWQADGGGAGNSRSRTGGGIWAPTSLAAITGITFFLSAGNWVANSVAELWGEP